MRQPTTLPGAAVAASASVSAPAEKAELPPAPTRGEGGQSAAYEAAALRLAASPPCALPPCCSAGAGDTGKPCSTLPTPLSLACLWWRALPPPAAMLW